VDNDEHVRVRERFEDSLRVMLCLRFSEDARARCERADREIERVQHALIDAHEHRARMREYLERTNVTAEQAIRIRTMGRR
jgi:hypothetical protein